MVKVSRTPCGKVTLLALVKLGAVSARTTGTAVRVGKMTAARTTRRTTRSSDSMRKLLGYRVGIVDWVTIEPALYHTGRGKYVDSHGIST